MSERSSYNNMMLFGTNQYYGCSTVLLGSNETFFPVDCLATIAKHCFVCFFGPGSKEQNNDHVYNEL